MVELVGIEAQLRVEFGALGCQGLCIEESLALSDHAQQYLLNEATLVFWLDRMSWHCAELTLVGNDTSSPLGLSFIIAKEDALLRFPHDLLIPCLIEELIGEFLVLH